MFGPLNFPSNTHILNNVNDINLICMCCDQMFDPNSDREDFMNHILEEHNVIIKDYEEIIDITGYVSFWKERLKSTTMAEICRSPEKGTGDDCFILSRAIKEDKELREKLLKDSLDKALEKQKFEREDISFCRKCLFCNQDIKPTRAEYLNHISKQHNLQLGKPDNLVYVDKFISLIEKQVESLKCIFCEKTFKDRNVLKEHMRKKLHKRVNPRNLVYDQFYMVNYLAPGKSNKRFLERKRRKIDDDDEDNDYDWSDWNEETDDLIVCLFCTESHTWEETLNHLKEKHNFNFKAIAKDLSFYHQVKLVNYIRRQIYKNKCIACNHSAADKEALLTHLSSENHLIKPEQQLWDQPEFFFPTYENDGFLCHLDEATNSDDEVDKSESKPFVPCSGGEVILQCLFCEKSNTKGEVMLEHMSNVHQFHYYDFMEDYNFAYRVQLLNYLKNQIVKMDCVHCSLHFDSKSVLLDHMVKENHFVAPLKQVWTNNEYKMTVGIKKNNSGVDAVDYIYALEGISDLKDINFDSDDCNYSDFEDDGVPILCLFCPHDSSSWKNILKHMYEIHSFSFVNTVSSLSFYDQVKYVVYTRSMVKESKCPVCSEQESDLLLHLKDKNHFILPPRELWDKSVYYPPTFVGDPFLSELNVHHTTDSLFPEQSVSKDLAVTVSNEKDKDDSDSSGWSDWHEEMKMSILCLFCETTCDSWKSVLSHMDSEHKFSYSNFSEGLSFYELVKAVNYIRKQVREKKCISCNEENTSSTELISHMTEANHLNLPNKERWDRDEFYGPTLENDEFLTHLDGGSDSEDDLPLK